MYITIIIPAYIQRYSIEPYFQFNLTEPHYTVSTPNLGKINTIQLKLKIRLNSKFASHFNTFVFKYVSIELHS